MRTWGARPARAAHDVGRAADLEGADGPEVLEFEVQGGGRLGVEGDEGSAQGDGRNVAAGFLHLREGDGHSPMVAGAILPLMPHIDRYEPGSFCWVELGTTDQSAAKSFYEALFGWKATDFPMGPGSFYTMFQLDGRDAGAAYTLTTELEQGVPPHWMLYVAVASADETAAKVKEAGGKVVAGPFDVATFGRMAVLQDPAGAHFSVWEAKDHFGMGIGGEPNTFCWADLSVPDQETAKKFYSAVFGWEIWEGKEEMGTCTSAMAGSTWAEFSLPRIATRMCRRIGWCTSARRIRMRLWPKQWNSGARFMRVP